MILFGLFKKTSLLFVLISWCPVVAQDSLLFIQSVNITELDKVATDTYGHLYVSDLKGNIHKFDSTGQFLMNYSPQRPGRVTLLEAWTTIRIFVFYRDFQEYLMLERFLGPMPQMPFDQEQIRYARMASLASDYNLWVLDETDFGLKKYDRQFNRILYRTALDLLIDPREYDVNFMREYQNNLYVNDKNSGILVFDGFGSYKKKIPFQGLEYFSFKEDEMCYLERDTLKFFHLYLFTIRYIPLRKDKKYMKALVYNRKIYAVRKDWIDIYELNNDQIKKY